jgi:hypothetical protein
MAADCDHCHGAVFEPSETRSFRNASEYEVLQVEPIGDIEGWLGSDDISVPGYAPFRIDFVLVTYVNFSYYEKTEGMLVRPI